MKVRRQVSGSWSQQNRRGAIFHYYLMYLLLTSILLSTAGFSLHMILDADQVDERISQHLKTLLRLERRLREDAGLAKDCSIAEALNFKVGEASIAWQIDGNRVTRQQTGEQHDTFEHFVLAAGTELSLEAEKPFVTLTITEAPVRIEGKPVDSAGRPQVQIVLPMLQSREGLR